MEELIEGNGHFAAEMRPDLLRELADRGQQPVAAVVACSDSRVPVELIFAQYEPGRIFTIRVAGNVIADASVKGSIEYAVEHLKVPELVILGHTGCGAVQACIDKVDKGELGRLISQMKLKSDDMKTAVLENVGCQVGAAMEIEAVKQAVANKTLEVFGAIYDIGNGKVRTVSRNGMMLEKK